MTVPPSVPPPTLPATGGPGAPPAVPAPPGTPPVPAPGDPQAPPAVPPVPNELEERLRRRQATLDATKDLLRPWQALGVTPEEVAALLAGRQPAPPAGAPPAGATPPVDVDALREQTRREVSAELTAQANRRVLEADVRAAAAADFQDPADVLRFLDVSTIEVGANGQAHPDDIKQALTGLLATKPYLAKVAGQRFTGQVDQGPRGSGVPKTLDEQIAEAQAAGNIRLAMHLQTSKLTAR